MPLAQADRARNILPLKDEESTFNVVAQLPPSSGGSRPPAAVVQKKRVQSEGNEENSPIEQPQGAALEGGRRPSEGGQGLKEGKRKNSIKDAAFKKRNLDNK